VGLINTAVPVEPEADLDMALGPSGRLIKSTWLSREGRDPIPTVR
jgi:hypothetical protein